MAHISTDTIIQWLDENDSDTFDMLVKESMTVSLKRYPPGSSSNTHDRVHQDDELYYVISGTGKVKIEDEVYSVTNGDTIFIEAGDWHTFFDVEETVIVLKIFPTKTSSAEIHREERPLE